MKNSKTLRAAIYARFSTHRQSEFSIEDQIRVCERFAERDGLNVVARFDDRGISGGTAQRPGYQRLLEAARRKEFDAVLAEDWKRLWREQGEQWRAIKELLDLGIEVVTVAGIDSRKPGFEILAAVMGAAAELDRKESGYRTRRGQEGKAIKGQSTGGKAYGYRNVKRTVGDNVITERAIEPKEAKVVRRIFQMRADGHSALAIARILNAEDIPPPGATWARTDGRKSIWRASALMGDPRFGTGILSNPLYRGRAVWGRMKWKRSAADSKIRKQIPTPEREWIVKDMPHLRIVDDALFDKVQKLQSDDSPLRQAIRKGIRLSPRRGKGSYWLSGILVCEMCGSNFQASGSESYSCPSHSAGKCDNNLRFKRADIEDAFLAILRDELLSPDSIKAEMRRIEAMLKEQERQEREAMHATPANAEFRNVGTKIAALRKLNLGAAAEQAAIRELEVERGELAARAAKKQSPGLREARVMLAQLPKIAKSFDKRLEDTLTGGKATRDEMRVISDATRALIVSGCIRMRPKGKTMAGRVTLLGLGEKALRVAGTTRRPRIGGSGGRI